MHQGLGGWEEKDLELVIGNKHVLSKERSSKPMAKWMRVRLSQSRHVHARTVLASQLYMLEMRATTDAIVRLTEPHAAFSIIRRDVACKQSSSLSPSGSKLAEISDKHLSMLKVL